MQNGRNSTSDPIKNRVGLRSGRSRLRPLDFLGEGVSRTFAVSIQDVIVQGFADSKSDIVPEYIEKRFYRWYESVSLGIGKGTKEACVVDPKRICFPPTFSFVQYEQIGAHL